MARRTTRRSFSLLEVVISSVILASLLLVTASVLVALQRASAATAHNMDMSQDVRRFLDELRRELRQTGYRYNEAGTSGVSQYMFGYHYGRTLGTEVDTATGPASVSVAGATINGYTAGPAGTFVFRVRTDMNHLYLDATTGDWTAFQFDSQADTGYVANSPNNLDGNWGTLIGLRATAQDTVRSPTGDVTRYTINKFIQTFNNAGASTSRLGINVLSDVTHFEITELSGANEGELLEVIIEVARPNPDWSNGVPKPLRLRVRERIRLLNQRDERG